MRFARVQVPVHFGALALPTEDPLFVPRRDGRTLVANERVGEELRARHPELPGLLRKILFETKGDGPT